jgi:hypothetical protein
VAIFGNFKDFPFIELISTLGRRAGKLSVWDLPSQARLELHLNGAVLQGLIVNGQPVTNVLKVRDHMVELMGAPAGTFEFSKLAPEQLQGRLSLPMSALMLRASSAVNEANVYRDRFPAPQTRFKLINLMGAWDDAELFEFVKRAQPALERGVSPLELSERLGLQLEQVQLYLYKLRTTGRIAPARVGGIKLEQPQLAGQSGVFQERVPQERPGLLSRLINALRFR